MRHSLLAISRAFIVASVAALAACGPDPEPAGTDVRVLVDEVALDPMGNPVVVLREQDGRRKLLIWIGIAEARSIASELEEITPPRPNTHDLTKQLIDGLEGHVERAIVTHLHDGTFYGLIVIQGKNGRVRVDSRPSDAIALALRVNAPVFVHSTLLDDPPPEIKSPTPPGREVKIHHLPATPIALQMRLERHARSRQLHDPSPCFKTQSASWGPCPFGAPRPPHGGISPPEDTPA